MDIRQRFQKTNLSIEVNFECVMGSRSIYVNRLNVTMFRVIYGLIWHILGQYSQLFSVLVLLTSDIRLLSTMYRRRLYFWSLEAYILYSSQTVNSVPVALLFLYIINICRLSLCCQAVPCIIYSLYTLLNMLRLLSNSGCLKTGFRDSMLF